MTVAVPEEGWYAAPSVVPALRSPHELTAISNRPLQQVPATSEQNTPAISALDAAGYLIWVYYEIQGDPLIDDQERPPIPDYSRFSYPFVYSESQLFPPQVDYGWSSAILWRRVGLNLAPTTQRPEPAALTVMIWEGTSASAGDVQAAEDIVGSVTVSVDGEVNG
jgi:hypothetical protein